MVGKTKWKSLELPLLRKTVNSKQYHIPGGISEINVTIKYLNNGGVVIPITSPFDLSILYVQKRDGL